MPKRRYDFGAMPPIPSLSDKDIADITAYVRSVQEERGRFHVTTIAVHSTMETDLWYRRGFVASSDRS